MEHRTNIARTLYKVLDESGVVRRTYPTKSDAEFFARDQPGLSYIIKSYPSGNEYVEATVPCGLTIAKEKPKCTT